MFHEYVHIPTSKQISLKLKGKEHSHLVCNLLLGLGEEASPSIRVYCLELALTDFGRDPRRSESGRHCGSFVFFVR